MTVSSNPDPKLAAFLADISAQIGDEKGAQKPFPPVENWHPVNCGDIGMEIRRDGSWWHEGRKITRPAMVKLFARILRKDDDGKTYLVTPHEKVIVHIEDAHFAIIRIDCYGIGTSQTIAVTTNLGEIVTISEANPLRVIINAETREPRVYVRIRGKLEAVFLRAPFYELIETAVQIGEDFGVFSSGVFFKIDKVD